MVGIVSLSPWDPGQCSEQQSSRSSGYQNYEQCSGLCWRQESVLSAIRAPLKRYELLHFFQDAPVVRATVKSLENHPWFMLKLSSLIFTFPALVNLSPDSPTQMFRQSLRILRSLMGFFALASAITELYGSIWNYSEFRLRTEDRLSRS